MKKTITCIGALLAAGHLTCLAQTQSDGAGNIFTAEDFERFSPLTALDMVRNIPGFQLEGTDNDRGLGQASGNVLINGERVSGKSNSPRDALGRIPVGRVDRVELRDAAEFGIPGLSGQVVNVITTGGAVSGVWEWDGRLRERLEPRLNQGEASLSGELGNLDWTVGFESDANRFGAKGPLFIEDADGNLLERQDEEIQGAHEYLEGTLGLSWSPDNGHEANFNASYAVYNFNRKQQGVRSPTGEDALFRDFQRGEDEWNSEISGDYAFPILGGDLKFIGLFRHEDSRFSGELFEADDQTGSFLNGLKLLDDFIENEAIGRVEFDWSFQEGRDWQIAAETAYNRLDAGSSFFLVDADRIATLDSREPPSLVEETRHEVSLTYSRPLTPKLRFQGSVSGEYSEISSQLGTDTQSQDFVRPKGYGALTYEPGEDTTYEFRIERDVGQLDFGDFVASQDINNGNNDAANRDLVPEQSWRFEITYDRSLGDLGAFEITAFHEEIEDRVDRIPLAGGGDAPGNVDSASRSELEAALTLNLDRFGLDGVQFEFEGETRLSSIEDPLTGETRRLSGNGVGFWFTELRWDIPNTDFAVLIAGERFRQGQNFRLNEISKFDQTDPFAWVEVEHKDFFGTNAYVRLGNIFDSADTESRIRFSPDRLGTLTERWEAERDFGYILSFGLSGTF
ncbi:MAG: hypothetical protein AAF216_10980 [Pseudomonadota bacterium]